MTDQAKIKQLAEDIANTLTDSLVKSGIVRDTPVKTKPDFKINKEFNPFVTKTLKNHLGEEIFELLAFMDITLAGGAIVSILTNQKINDFDLYAKSKEDAYILASVLNGVTITKELNELFIDGFSGYVQEMTTDRSIIFRKMQEDSLEDRLKGLDLPPLLQVMTFKFADKIEDLFNSFDFTACMGAYSFKDEHLYLHQDFMFDNLGKNLIFNPNTDYPFNSLLRVHKYIEKGFDISNPQILRIAMACTRKGLDSWSDIKEEISGMYGVNVDDLFNEDKDFSLDEVINQLGSLSKNLKETSFTAKKNEYISELIDKNFNPELIKYTLMEDGVNYTSTHYHKIYTENLKTVVKALAENKISTGAITVPEQGKDYVMVISTDVAMELGEDGFGYLNPSESYHYKIFILVVHKDKFLNDEDYFLSYDSKYCNEKREVVKTDFNVSYATLVSRDDLDRLLPNKVNTLTALNEDGIGHLFICPSTNNVNKITLDVNKTIAYHTRFPIGNTFGDRVLNLCLAKAKDYREKEEARKEALQEKRDDAVEQWVAGLLDVEFISQ